MSLASSSLALMSRASWLLLRRVSCRGSLASLCSPLPSLSVLSSVVMVLALAFLALLLSLEVLFC